MYVYNGKSLQHRGAAGEVVWTLLAEPTAQGLFPEHPIPGTKKPVRWMSCDSSAGFEYLLGRVNRKVRICLSLLFSLTCALQLTIDMSTHTHTHSHAHTHTHTHMHAQCVLIETSDLLIDCFLPCSVLAHSIAKTLWLDGLYTSHFVSLRKRPNLKAQCHALGMGL